MNNAVLLTAMPSPYMVELIDAVNLRKQWRISPLYERESSEGRRWSRPETHDDFIILEKDGWDVAQKIISEADIVVIGTLWGNNSSRVLKYQKINKKPLVFWGERPGAVRRNIVAKTIRRLAISRRFGHARAVWGIGQWAVEEYKKCLPSVKQFVNMPYASDLSSYFSIPLRENAASNRRQINFLYCGSLIRRKGIDLLIPAFIRLLNEGYKANLTVMGHGELDSILKSMVPEKNKCNINFIGFKDWNELPGIYAEHDVLVAPSRYDGWGLIVMEGLAAGMPVIATEKMGSAIDFIKDGENGWIIPAGDGDSLYKTLKLAMNVPLYEMGISARKSAGRWSLEKAAEHWCDLADGVFMEA